MRTPASIRRLSRPEMLEQRQLLAGDFAQNPRDALDVNDDGLFSTRDLLALVASMTSKQPQAGMYFDVDGDGGMTRDDAMMLVHNLGDRPPRFLGVRSIDGTDNHPDDLGAANTPLLRLAPPAYSDGRSTPAGEDRPNPRTISNAIARQLEDQPSESGLSAMVWQWGQFIDHDMDLSDKAEPVEPMPTPIPPGDPAFDPRADGDKTMAMDRTIHAADPEGIRQQINEITAFLDGSQIYGSDLTRATALRSFEGGRLKVSDGDLPPRNVDRLPNAGGDSPELFLAGDRRANEQTGLLAMHTVWVREHNRIADELGEAHPYWTDEDLFQTARRTVIAELQAITYNEFLPALLGEDAIPPYRGYDPTADPRISNEFSTAAYRIGHSMLSSELPRLTAPDEPASEGPLPLRDAFFRPDHIEANGIDSVLLGLAYHPSQEIDTRLVEDVRSFLFGPPGAGGFDLATLNIQRGRDHGLPDYNTIRESMGLPRLASFADLTRDSASITALEAVYGDIDSLDPWVGMLAEDHAEPSNLGELAHVILVDQFRRVRDGDRYWYQNIFVGEDLATIEATRLSDVLLRNTDITELERDVFRV